MNLPQTHSVKHYLCPFRCYVYRHRIWTVTASRTPYNYQLFAINLLYRSARQVVWSHFVIVAHHLLQNVIYIFHWHAFYRSYCHACLIIGIYTDNDISTTKVIKVIGESTYTVIYASWVVDNYFLLNLVNLIVRQQKSVQITIKLPKKQTRTTSEGIPSSLDIEFLELNDNP